MKIEKMSDGVFYLLKGPVGDRRDLCTNDNTDDILPEFVRFKKAYPELRIVSVTPLLETVVWDRSVSPPSLANMGYMIITEPALPQNMPCGCRCLIHGKVD